MVNNEVNVRFKAGPEFIPTYETDGAACMDIKSAEDVIISPGKVHPVSTGLFVQIEPGYEILIRPRSGMALNKKIAVLNSPGTIDEDYRDEIKVILMNFGDSPFEVKRGDRIAQMTVSPVYKINWVLVENLSKTDRKGGFGSTGV